MATDDTYLKLGEFDNHIKHVDSIFGRKQNLPDMVFLHGLMNHFYFFEFDLMIAPGFMSDLRRIAGHFRDDVVFVTVLDPDPIDYFYRHFGRPGAFRMPAESAGDEYFAILSDEPPGSSADALLYNSRIVAWNSSGNQWGIWGDRDSGIGVLGAEEDLASLWSGLFGVPKLVAADIAAFNLRLDDAESANYKSSLDRNF